MTQVQQSYKFTMPSGAVLVVTMAPFADSMALMKASMRTLKGMELKPEDLKREMEDFLRSPGAISLMLDRVVEFATSPEVETAVWRCSQRALYIPLGSPVEFPGHRVGPALFDDPEHGHAARGDFAKIVTALLEVNCLPFLEKALSGLLRPKESGPESRPSK